MNIFDWVAFIFVILLVLGIGYVHFMPRPKPKKCVSYWDAEAGEWRVSCEKSD